MNESTHKRDAQGHFIYEEITGGVPESVVYPIDRWRLELSDAEIFDIEEFSNPMFIPTIKEHALRIQNKQYMASLRQAREMRAANLLYVLGNREHFSDIAITFAQEEMRAYFSDPE